MKSVQRSPSGISLRAVFFWLCCALPVLAQNDVYDIEAFGEFGELTPTFIGSRPNPAFFSRPVTKSFATRTDFTASLALDIVKRDFPDRSWMPGDLEILIRNDGGATRSVVVSAIRNADNQVKNYLVGVPSGQSIRVQLGELLDMDDLFFVSIGAFSAQSSWYSGETKETRELAVKPPNPQYRETETRITAPANICRNETVIMRVHHPSGPYEDAWFDRRYAGQNTQCPMNPTSLYEIDVYWPTQNILHHCSNLQSIICSQPGCTPGVDCTPPCQISGYSTNSLVNGNELLWRHIDDGMQPYPLFSFDNVLFSGHRGIVYCRRIRPGGECVDNPNLFWYVYQPSAPPCP